MSNPQCDDLIGDLFRHKPAASDCSIVARDYRKFLQGVPSDSVDLMLTDPPYAISKDTGFRSIGAKSVERFAVSMDFGEWDKAEIDLKKFCQLAYKVLRSGGTTIVFYDLWKISYLAEAMTKAGLVQIRLIEWKKKNPVPLNSKRNYLTNSREVAVLGVKDGKPTFNSEYDNGSYEYPIPNNGKRLHPTQKPLELFVALVSKHSNKGDLVIDPFLGCGTTAVAAIREDRRFAGCDMDGGYIDIARARVADEA